MSTSNAIAANQAAAAASNTAPTFMVHNGKLVTDFGFSAEGQSIAVQTDGKIVVAGDGGGFFIVARYNADGALDVGFGNGGRLTTSFGDWGAGHGLMLQPDGKIVVTGWNYAGTSTNFATVRYNVDGTLDTSFGGDGKVITDFFGADEHGSAIARQADGKILVSGDASRDFGLVRYNTDGSLDTTFDGDGKVVTTFDASGGDGANSIVVQSDGKIVAAGYVLDSTTLQYSIALARYNTNGSLDTSFDFDGKLTTLVGTDAEAFSVVLQSDGKILVSGLSDADPSIRQFVVVRYNVNGSLDTTFDGDGKVTTDFAGGFAYSMAVQSDGRIVVAGSAGDDFALVRYNTNGSLDTTFDGDGKVTTDFNGGSYDQAFGMTLQANGKILVTGFSNNGDVAVARYNADGSLDAANFGGINTLDGAPTYTANGPAVVLDSDVSILDAELAAQGHYAGARLTLVRHGGANAQDVYSATGSLGVLTQGSALTYAGTGIGTVTTNSGGTLVLSFNSNATQARVNGALQSIAYANTSAVPPHSVQIDWAFSDGNSGGQGAGGALAGRGSTVVHVTTDYLWSSLTNGQVIGTFDPDVDRLRFDLGTISAADVRVDGGGTSVAFSYAGKTVTLNIDEASLTTHNVIFDNGSMLVVGDGTTGVTNDAAGNMLQGGFDNDQLIGLGGSDNLSGGNGSDVLIGGAAGDSMDGGFGFDYASYDLATAGVVANLGAPAGNTGDAAGDTYLSIEGLIGTRFRDTLVGDNNLNDIQGRDGNDSLYGLGGNDTIRGGTGDDNLYGGTGADLLDGGTGFDYARYDTATAGVVIYLSAPGNNTGEAAGDTYLSIEGLVGTSFRDTLVGDNNANDIQGRGGDDSLVGAGGNDTVQGSDGNDYLTGGTGADVLDGGTGFDYARYDSAATGVTVDLAGTFANTGEAVGDSFMAVEGVVGSSFGDFLYGDGNANVLQGRDGDDSISGRAGNDDLWSGNGNDTLDGGLGADTLAGEAGNDTFRFTAGEAGGDRVLDFAGNGASAGDRLIFQGYGTAAQNATFTKIDATHWSINSASGLVHDIITLSNAAPVHVSDYTFI